MTSISYNEARTNFSELLDQVARGKRILIIRRGRPVEMLMPPLDVDRKDVKEVIEAMKALRRGNKPGKGLSIPELIDEGRRF